MLDYTLKDEIRAEMAQAHRTVQIAISAIANQSFGCQDDPDGIGKYQGGVKVNGQEICIRKFHVMDDWKRSVDVATPEEQATVVAIEAVAQLVEAGGLAALAPYEGRPSDWDPLRSMFPDHQLA